MTAQLPRYCSDSAHQRVAKLVRIIQHITHRRVLCLVEEDSDGQVYLIAPAGSERRLMAIMTTLDFDKTKMLAEEYLPYP